MQQNCNIMNQKGAGKMHLLQRKKACHVVVVVFFFASWSIVDISVVQGYS